MKEQSHKSEMRAAVRGDFERLRARRGEPVEETLQMPRPEPVEAPPVEPAEPVAAVVETEAVVEPEVAEPLADAAAEAEPEPEPEPLPPAAVAETDSAPEPATDPGRRSWLDRLRGRT